MDAEIYKVVVSGPFGAGKTTFINSVARDVLGSERDVTDATAALKGRTTVAMDHGTARLDDGAVVSLFGTPGQERFNFMWPVLARGMHAYVLLVDVSRLQAQAQLKSILRQFRQFAPGVPHLIAANRWEQEAVPVEDLATFVGVDAREIVACDPREPDDVRAILSRLVDIARPEQVEEAS